METGPDLAVDLRLLLLGGCLDLEEEEEESFDADGFSVLQRDRDQWMRREINGKGVHFWYTIRVFLEKETNYFDILQVSLETFSLARGSRQFAPWTAIMMVLVPLPIAGVGRV